LKMEKIALLFACLVCASHGRRIQTWSAPSAEGQEAVSADGAFSRGAFEPRKALAAFFLACTEAAAFNPSSPAFFRGANHAAKNRVRSPLAGAEDEYDIIFEKGKEAQLFEAAGFSTDYMWGSSTTFELEGPMSVRTREAVLGAEKDDMVARYGEIVGSRRFDSQLISARDKKTGELVGIVGVEVAVLDMMEGKVFERRDADNMVKDEIGRMSVRERAPFRQMTITETMAKLFPEYTVSALLANLVIAPSTRGKGLGRVLCAKCEEKAREWGMPGIVLQVEEANAAGRPLYQKLGYQDIHVNPDGQAQRIQRGVISRVDAFKLEPSTIYLMGKAV